MFTAKQIDQLSAPLDRATVKTRTQSGRALSYIEGWHAIAEANRIFGFGEWSSETIDIRIVSEGPREIGQAKTPGFGVSYIARVRITVGSLIREGVGSGHGIDRDLGLAHESAVKEAETDARKRALMTFGNPFGLALYDKDQANVADAPSEALIAAKSELDACTTIAELATVWTAKSKGYGKILGDADWAALVAHKDKLKASLPSNDQKDAA